MTGPMLVMVLGAFLVGGAISLSQQKKPAWSVVSVAAVAVALIGYGAYSWFLAVP